MDQTEDSNLQNLIIYARAINFLLSLEKLTYGFMHDFLADNFRSCIENNLITVTCYLKNKQFWQDHNIRGYHILGNADSSSDSLVSFVETCEMNDKHRECLQVKGPPGVLRYSDTPKKYWKFPMMQLELPEGFKLVYGCECESDISWKLGTFRVANKDGNTLLTTSFFETKEVNDSEARFNQLRSFLF